MVTLTLISTGLNMTLHYTVTEVPEGLETYYEEKDGAYVLKVEGLPQPQVDTTAKTKLDEFRTTNIALKQQIEELQSKTKVADVSVDELVKQAVAPMSQRLQLIEQERTHLQAQLEEVVLSDKIKEEALKAGVYDTALQDIVNRAKATFTVKDGKPLSKTNAVDENGNALSPEAWIQALTKDAPHFFKQSQGTGARRPVGATIVQERTAAQKISDGLRKQN